MIDRAAFNSYFTELYDERSKLDKAIRDKAKSITSALDDSLNPVMLGSNSVFIGDETILLGVWSETSERIHQDFLNQVRAAEAKDAADNAHLSASRAALAAIDAKNRADKAQKNADVALSNLGDIYSDGKVTPSEKQQIKTLWTEIKETDVEVRANAEKYEVSLEMYLDGYTELVNLVNILLLDMNTTTDVNRTTLDNRFETYYMRRAVVNKNIVEATEKAISNAQDSADAVNASLNPLMVGNSEYLIGNDEILIGSKTIYHDSEQALENFKPQNLSKLVEGSGAYATKFGAIAGQYSKMEGVIEGQKAAIETYSSVGNLEALKIEISKERLNKSIEGLDAQKAKLTTAIADFNSQITLLNTKIANTEIAEAKREYLNQISKLETAIANANAEKSIIDDNKRQLATEVRELDDLKLVKEKILLESGIKMTAPGGKIKGVGLLMEDTGYTDFDILVDSFTMSVSENASSIKPFRVNGTEFEVNVPLKANSTITTPSIKGGSITGTSININDKFKVSSQGNLVATSGTFGGTVTGGNINIANKFKVDSSGNMTATSGSFSGDITGASGTFNGTVYANKISGKVANIADGVIDTAQIANGAIETAKIGNAQVDTLQVKGNAITVAELFYAEQMMTFNIAKTSSEIAHLYIDAEGGSVSVSFGFDYMRIYNYGDNTGATVVMKIMRGSTKLREVNFSSEGRRGSFTNEYVSLATFLDNPPAGSHRYAVTVETSNTNENVISGQIKARSLLIAGAKDDK